MFLMMEVAEDLRLLLQRNRAGKVNRQCSLIMLVVVLVVVVRGVWLVKV